MPAPVPEGLAVLPGLPGQGGAVGDAAVRPGRVPAQPQLHPEEVGLPGAHLRPRGLAQGAGALQEGGRGLQVSRVDDEVVVKATKGRFADFSVVRFIQFGGVLFLCSLLAQDELCLKWRLN